MYFNSGNRLLSAVLIMTTTGFAQDRMPLIPADKMTEAQKKVASDIAAGPRGSMNTTGPFIPLLRTPELLDAVQRMGVYMVYHHFLPEKLMELTILITVRRWTDQYEWNSHYPRALKAGVKADIANAIADGRRPTGMSEDEELAYDFTSEVDLTGSVSDATYARAVD